MKYIKYQGRKGNKMEVLINQRRFQKVNLASSKLYRLTAGQTQNLQLDVGIRIKSRKAHNHHLALKIRRRRPINNILTL